ncbi:TetR/AcrR family transcriptional regulator [Labedella endophytica]|uniref:TetR/AcrR family transcriptional regulator n=1 Tax=Labedella endophytica TaxID=1523160 RepID=A0A3S0VBH2_9MICO|nr:TetR/AcrR family transcriptional regulator [Labedella endophytica]RUR01560.1 TetR/AcrR family transcriptional regulator [Labedella endophytica]
MSSDVDSMQPVAESERRRRTRERLMDAAFEVFAEEGVHSASVEAICERAGFSRGAFYSNFESKEELFFALSDREVDSTLLKASELARDVLPATPTDGADVVAEVVRTMIAFVGGEANWHRIVAEYRLLAMRDGAIAPRYVDFSRRLNDRVVELLQTVTLGAGLRFVGDLQLISRTLLALFSAITEDQLLAGVAGAPDVAAEDSLAFDAIVAYVHLVTEPDED